jgi:transposase, IS5 family
MKVKSWSFDKAFYSKTNKELLAGEVGLVVMPKKGKLTNAEKEEESQREFKGLRNKHSAVESNINELEHRGLDRCPDRGYAHFKRYIGLGICAYNLHKIGAHLRATAIEEAQEAEREKKAKARESLAA